MAGEYYPDIPAAPMEHEGITYGSVGGRISGVGQYIGSAQRATGALQSAPTTLGQVQEVQCKALTHLEESIAMLADRLSAITRPMPEGTKGLNQTERRPVSPTLEVAIAVTDRIHVAANRIQALIGLVEL
jgi:hypothetical protein